MKKRKGKSEVRRYKFLGIRLQRGDIENVSKPHK